MDKPIYKFKPTDHSERNDMAMFLITSAIGKERWKINDMRRNEDGTVDVKLTVGGVSIDFGKFVQRLSESYNKTLSTASAELLMSKFSGIIDTITDIQERIEANKQMFKYDYE